MSPEMATSMRGRRLASRACGVLGVLAVILALGLLVLVRAAGARTTGDRLTHVLRLFFQRHRVNTVGVAFFAILVVVVGYSSGQTTDSVRAWTASATLSRGMFGTASTILLA